MVKLIRFHKIIFLLLLSLVLCPCIVHASAQNDKDTVTYEAIVIDDADLLTEAQENDLLEYVKPILSNGNVIISTTILNNSANYEKNCEDVYYQHYGNEPGINMQIDMGNRKITLSCSTEMEELLGKERDSIVSNIYEYATDGDYYSCFHECFREVQLILNDGVIAHKMKYIDNAILAVFIGLLINAMVIFLLGKKKRSRAKVLGSLAVVSAVTSTTINKGKLIKIYDPPSSSSGGSGGSSGGGGGGGFSGGSSSHGF